LEKLEQNYDVDIDWHSFELRPAGSPPMPPQRRAQIEASRPMFQKRAREQYGVEVNAGPFGINSRPALILEKYAQSQGKGDEFHKAVMHAYWQEARSIDDPSVLKELAEQVGLNTENFDDILADLTFDTQVTADVEQAYEYGLNAVPALVFADRYLVMGAQPYEVLKQAVEKVQEENRA
jgi:predicted DsbA family dithiol-disulfide isomerase